MAGGFVSQTGDAGARLFRVPGWRVALGFAMLFLLYQSAEGVGARMLGSAAVQGGLMIATLVAAWPVGRWLLRWHGYAAYGLAWQSRVPLWIVTGLVVSALAKAAAIAVGLSFGVYGWSVAPVPGLSLAGVAFAMLATFVASIAEDIITRGLWWRVDATSATALRFVGATAVIYTLNHVFRLSNGPAEWFMLLCLGIAYAAAMARTGSLWAAVGLHWGWNLANALVDSVVSLDADTALLPWLSGATNLVIAAVVLALPRGWAGSGGLTATRR